MEQRCTHTTFKTAIFDFDGTIIDSSDAVLEVMGKLADQYGFRALTAEELAEIRTKPLAERLRIMGIPKWKVPGMARTALRHFSDLMDQFPLYEGIGSVIEQAEEAGMRLFILSSNNRKNIDRCLERHDITSFEAIRTASGLFSKTRHLKRMMRRFRIDASSAVYIGDELRDMEAAHAAGLQAIAVTWGYDERPLLESGKPEYIADRVEELRSLLLPLPNDSERVST